MNAWAAKVLEIPVEKIKLNKHLNPSATKEQLTDPKSLYFTLSRVKPLSMTTQKEDITFVHISINTRLLLIFQFRLSTNQNTRRTKRRW